MPTPYAPPPDWGAVCGLGLMVFSAYLSLKMLTWLYAAGPVAWLVAASLLSMVVLWLLRAQKEETP